MAHTIDYRKVASSRPVYYSFFDNFWGATNQDVLLTETCYYCYVQKSMKCWVHKRLHEFSSIFVDLPRLALFLKTPFKNVLKSFDRALLLSCKCIFISKIWKNSWGSYILVGNLLFLPECRILKNSNQIFFQFLLVKMHLHNDKNLLLLTKTCYYSNFWTFWGCY